MNNYEKQKALKAMMEIIDARDYELMIIDGDGSVWLAAKNETAYDLYVIDLNQYTCGLTEYSIQMVKFYFGIRCILDTSETKETLAELRDTIKETHDELTPLVWKEYRPIIKEANKRMLERKYNK